MHWSMHIHMLLMHMQSWAGVNILDFWQPRDKISKVPPLHDLLLTLNTERKDRILPQNKEASSATSLAFCFCHSAAAATKCSLVRADPERSKAR